MMSDKIRECRTEGICPNFLYPLKDWLQEIERYASYPGAAIEFHGVEVGHDKDGNDLSYAKYEIHYSRPETEKERADREKYEARRAEAVREAELKMLRELLAKYGKEAAGE